MIFLFPSLFFLLPLSLLATPPVPESRPNTGVSMQATPTRPHPPHLACQRWHQKTSKKVCYIISYQKHSKLVYVQVYMYMYALVHNYACTCLCKLSPWRSNYTPMQLFKGGWTEERRRALESSPCCPPLPLTTLTHEELTHRIHGTHPSVINLMSPSLPLSFSLPPLISLPLPSSPTFSFSKISYSSLPLFTFSLSFWYTAQ